MTAQVPRALIPAMLRIAGPVALARLGVMGMGVVDTIVVGQLAGGDLAYLALGWAPTSVFLVTGIGLLVGVQVLAARVIGEGRPQAAGAVWRRGMMLALVAGVASGAGLFFSVEHLLRTFGIAPELAQGSARVAHILALSLPLHFLYVACASFLEGLQRPIAGTVVIWGANLLNLALNVALVPLLGAEGSAWATVLSRVFMAGALVWWILQRTDLRAFGVAGAAPGAPGYGALLAVGAAAAVSQAAEAGAFSAMTVIAGRIGPEAVAAYQIMLNTLAMVFMVAMGLAAATAVLVAEAAGRRDARAVVRAGWTGLVLNSIAMALSSIGLLVAGAWIARGFTADPALVVLLVGLMPVAALITVPDGGQVVLAGGLRARGDNWFPTASHVLAYVCVMPPLGYYLGEVLGRGVQGLLESIFLASVLSVAVLIARFAMLGRSTRRAAPTLRAET